MNNLLAQNFKVIGSSLFLLFSIMFLYFSFFIFNPNCLSADSTLPSNYCFVQNVTITNNKNTDMSYKSIRLTKDTQTLIQSGIVDNSINTYSLTNPSLNNIEFVFTNFNDIASPLWIVPTNLNASNSVIYSLYYGTNSQFRDPGLYFDGLSSATIGDSNDLDLTDNFNIIVDINPLKFSETCPATSSDFPSLLNKTSYHIYFYCQNGTINVFATLTGSSPVSLTGVLNTNLENKNFQIKVVKKTSIVELYINDILVDSSATTFTLSTNNDPLLIGNTNLKGVVIRNVSIENNLTNLQTATYTFNNLQETSSSVPNYNYSFNDSIGSNNGVYSKNYDSSGIVFTFANPDSEIIQFIDQIADVSGKALTGVNTLTSTNAFNPIVPVVEPVAQGIRLPSAITYTVLFSVIGLLIATGLNSFFPNPIFSIVGFLIPISLGSISGLLPISIFWIFLLISIAGWGVLNWSRNR